MDDRSDCEQTVSKNGKTTRKSSFGNLCNSIRITGNFMGKGKGYFSDKSKNR